MFIPEVPVARDPTIELTHRLRTTAGSHERFLVIEVFGRYAGFTALLPAMAGAYGLAASESGDAPSSGGFSLPPHGR